MDKNQKIMALGNQIGRTYVWDMDVEEPSLIKHTLLSHPRVGHHANPSEQLSTLLAFIMIVMIPFIPVYHCHPPNKSEPRWKHSDHCLRRWNCLEVNRQIPFFSLVSHLDVLVILAHSRCFINMVWVQIEVDASHGVSHESCFGHLWPSVRYEIWRGPPDTFTPGKDISGQKRTQPTFIDLCQLHCSRWDRQHASWSGLEAP